MIVFTIDIVELIGLLVMGILVVILVCLHVCERIADIIENRRSRK